MFNLLTLSKFDSLPDCILFVFDFTPFHFRYGIRESQLAEKCALDIEHTFSVF